MEFKFNLERFHFNKEAFQREFNRKSAQALKRFGAYTRRTAQRSMKLQPKYINSKPGQPLFSHGNQTYKKNILFAYEPKGNYVVIGPRLLSRSAAYMIPRLHEKGGHDRRGNYEIRSVMIPAFLTTIKQFKGKFFSGSNNGEV